MGVDIEEDIKRLLVDLNLKAARKRQSSQTGYVHHCYENEGGDQHDTIPLCENFCFSLALLRSKQTDNLMEGMALLSKLLKFEVEGNFPVYLHEFPQCKDRYLGIRLLPVLHGLKDFYSIFPSELQTRINQLVANIQCLNSELPPFYEMIFKAYFEPEFLSPHQPTTGDHMGWALIAHHMAQSRGGSLNPLHETLLQHWHPGLHTCVGAQEQEKLEPKPTLYDLYLCDYTRSYPKRLLADHPVHLRASLIDSHPQRGVIERVLAIPYHHGVMHSRQPYALYWNTLEHLHTLVCDPRQSTCHVKISPTQAHFSFQLKPQLPEEDEMEIAFFCDRHPAHQFTTKATTFQVGDEIEIISHEQRFKLVFSLAEGEGQFFGHIMPANRPMQTMAKGARRFEAFDWQISLRTIKRTEHCVLHAQLHLDCGSLAFQ